MNILMKKTTIIIFSLFLLLGCNRGSNENNCTNLTKELELQLNFFAENNSDPEKVARTYTDSSGYHMVAFRDWTSGFPAGTFWQIYELTQNEKWIPIAVANTVKLEGVQHLKSTHDLGFMAFCSYGNAYRLTGDESYKQVVLQASESLITRFNPTIGCIKSWDHNTDKWQYPVIIDNMMNLEMLFWASKTTGDPKYRDIAVTHANTTLANHFRDDMSSFHVVSYDTITGQVEKKQTHQGLTDESAWARGQAWGLYGYTMVFRETQDPKFLDAATRIADFMLQNLPEDYVFYWDFNDPAIPHTERDASAAAITASALLELSTFEGVDQEKYRTTALKIVDSLSSDQYLAETGTNGGFLLKHCVGHKPAGKEIDVPLNYADYYYLEALNRKKQLNLQ